MTIKDLLDGKPCFPTLLHSYPYKDKKVLVTGACGSIGNAVYQRLLKENVMVVGVDWNEAEVAKTDDIVLSDFIHMDYRQYDVVIHCAAYKHVRLSWSNSKAFEINNASKVREVLMRMRLQVPKPVFVYISTDKVTGSSALGKSKKLGETYVSEYARDFGRSIRLVNCAFSKGSVLDKWRNGSKEVCDPDTRRYFMQIEDAVNVILHMPSLFPGRYTVMGLPEFSIHSLAQGMGIPKEERSSVALSHGEAVFETLISNDETIQNTDVEWIKRIV